MHIYRYFLLSAAFLMAFTAIPILAAAEENVTVTSESVKDADGFAYGANFFINSTVNTSVEAFPYVDAKENAKGKVFSAIVLKANESHVPIGSFESADHSKPWSVVVKSQWKRQ